MGIKHIAKAEIGQIGTDCIGKQPINTQKQPGLSTILFTRAKLSNKIDMCINQIKFSSIALHLGNKII